MNKIIKFALVLLSTLGLILGTASTSFSKVEGDKIILGAAVSLTGKYSSNGVHTQNGYNMAVDRINSMGGVKVGGKTYKFEIIYYDDEAVPKISPIVERRTSANLIIFFIIFPSL